MSAIRKSILLTHKNYKLVGEHEPRAVFKVVDNGSNCFNSSGKYAPNREIVVFQDAQLSRALSAFLALTALKNTPLAAAN